MLRTSSSFARSDTSVVIDSEPHQRGMCKASLLFAPFAVRVHAVLIGAYALINYFSTSGDLCHQLITSANSLEPDRTEQNVGPDLEPNHLNLR